MHKERLKRSGKFKKKLEYSNQRGKGKEGRKKEKKRNTRGQ